MSNKTTGGSNVKYMIYDKYGYPVEGIRGRWMTNLLRYLIHGRSIHKTTKGQGR